LVSLFLFSLTEILLLLLGRYHVHTRSTSCSGHRSLVLLLAGTGLWGSQVSAPGLPRHGLAGWEGLWGEGPQTQNCLLSEVVGQEGHRAFLWLWECEAWWVVRASQASTPSIVPSSFLEADTQQTGIRESNTDNTETWHGPRAGERGRMPTKSSGHLHGAEAITVPCVSVCVCVFCEHCSLNSGLYAC
jgi:hypothetical protein